MTADGAALRGSNYLRTSLPLRILALVVGGYGLLLCLRGITLGESLTFFVIREDLPTVFRRAREFQGQSPLYFVLLHLWTLIAGSSEIALRLPSIACFLLSVGVVDRLAAALHTPYPRMTSTSYLILGTIWSEGILLQARPYAASMLLLLLSLLALVKFIEGGSKPRMLALHVLSFVGSIQFCFIFSPSGLLLAVVALLSASRRQFAAMSAAHAAGALLYLPFLDQAQSIVHERFAWSYIRTLDVLDVLLPAILLLPLLGIAISRVKRIRRGQRIDSIVADDPQPRLLWICLAWILLPGLSAMIVQYALGTSIGSPRYMIWGMPGAALLSSLTFPGLAAARGRAVMLWCTAACGVLLNLHGIVPKGWRDAVRTISGSPSMESPCVLVYSGLVEANSPALPDSPALRDYLVSPLRYYLSDAHLVPLPFVDWSEPYARFFDAWLESRPACHRGLWMVIADGPPVTTADGSPVDLSLRFGGRLLDRGWRLEAESSRHGFTLSEWKRL